MHQCPSKQMLLDLKHIEPYHAYCDHCVALYKPVVEKYGYTYHEEIDADHASCQVIISKKLK